MNIEDKVNSFKTKHKQGFISSEIEELLSDYPDIDRVKFNNALSGITCMVIDDEIIIYHCDIITALRCGIEKREIRGYEFD